MINRKYRACLPVGVSVFQYSRITHRNIRTNGNGYLEGILPQPDSSLHRYIHLPQPRLIVSCINSHQVDTYTYTNRLDNQADPDSMRLRRFLKTLLERRGEGCAAPLSATVGKDIRWAEISLADAEAAFLSCPLRVFLQITRYLAWYLLNHRVNHWEII